MRNALVKRELPLNKIRVQERTTPELEFQGSVSGQQLLPSSLDHRQPQVQDQPKPHVAVLQTHEVWGSHWGYLLPSSIWAEDAGLDRKDAARPISALQAHRSHHQTRPRPRSTRSLDPLRCRLLPVKRLQQPNLQFHTLGRPSIPCLIPPRKGTGISPRRRLPLPLHLLQPIPLQQDLLR